MELDTFIITIEDFLEGRIDENFLKEEMIYAREEADEYYEKIKDSAQEKILTAIQDIINSLEKMEVYFTGEHDREYIKSALEKIREANLIIESNSPDLFPEDEENPAEENKEETSYNTQELISSPEPDYAVQEGMKSKLPPKTYYEKNIESNELKIEYISDPVDSPLYNLLTGYQEFEAKQIDIKIWMQKLLEAEEELNYLIDKSEELELDIEQSDRFKKYILKALRIIEQLQIEGSENKINEEMEFIKELRKLNLDIYNIQKKILPGEENILNINDSIREAYEKFEDEDYKTANFKVIEKGVNDFLNGVIEKEELQNIINKMNNIILNAQEQYENLPVSEEELTLEVLRGDKLLTEGLMSWLYGLEILEDGMEDKDEEMLLEGIDYIFTGNKKLVIVQYFSDQVQKQCQFQKSFKDNL